ncbi:MAG: glycosyltransferase family 4 protein [Planctomycetota bacterium]
MDIEDADGFFRDVAQRQRHERHPPSLAPVVQLGGDSQNGRHNHWQRAVEGAHCRRMRVLLLAYYFPPDGGPGAQRPISFARHLPASGHEVVVVTRSAAGARGRFDPADATGLEAIERGCEVVRAAPAGTSGATGLSSVLAALVTAGDAAIRRHRPEVVLVTMSPFELWRVAATLGDRHDIPVVADLRDPWAFDGVQNYRSWLRWRREWRQMRAMLRRADGVIANTPECETLFRRCLPRSSADRVVLIPNGWDRDDFAGPPREIPPGDTLTLVYGGTFLCSELYQQERLARRVFGWMRYAPEPIEPSGRTPQHLLGAMRRLRERKAPAAAALRFTAIGTIDAALQRCVRDSGMADRVELRDYQSHSQLIAAIRAADALFLTLHGLRDGHRSRIVPGKTYEYLATGRPILAALPEGDARELVARSPRSLLCKPCIEEEIADRLEELHRNWRRGEYRGSLSAEAFANWERRKLCDRLAAFLSQVITQTL